MRKRKTTIEDFKNLKPESAWGPADPPPPSKKRLKVGRLMVTVRVLNGQGLE